MLTPCKPCHRYTKTELILLLIDKLIQEANINYGHIYLPAVNRKDCWPRRTVKRVL